METINGENMYSLMGKVLENDKLTPAEKAKLLDEIRKSRPALEDKWIYRWIVYFLGAAVIITILAGFSFVFYINLHFI